MSEMQTPPLWAVTDAIDRTRHLAVQDDDGDYRVPHPNGTVFIPPTRVTDVAPVAAIDTLGMSGEAISTKSVLESVTARIREAQEPDEPTAVGACVRDGRSERWTRDRDGSWRRLSSPPGQYIQWRYLPRPVEVLWDGVPG